MAYAAVISLKNTIHRLLSCTTGSCTREILEFAYVEVKSLQEVLKRVDAKNSRSKRLDALDGEIREAVYKVEDSLEFHELNWFLSEMEIQGDLELEQFRQEISSLVVLLKKAEEEFNEELNKPCISEEEEEEDNVGFWSSRDFGVEMVGLSNEVSGIKKKLLKGTRPDDFGVFWIVGRAGSGRTIVANTIFDESYIRREQCFDCGAWVTIGQKYDWKEILVAILRQLDSVIVPHAPDSLSETNKAILTLNPDSTLRLRDEELLVDYLYTHLKGRKYMIVLDDVCDAKVWDFLRRSFPNQDNGSLVLLTTSFEDVALSSDHFHISRMPDFDEDAAWNLLRTVIYGGRSCPPILEEIGKKIVNNCQGLRLVLVKVVLYLSRNKKIPEHWCNLAADKDNHVFMVADEISEVCRMKEDLYESVHDDDERASMMQPIPLPSQLCYERRTI